MKTGLVMEGGAMRGLFTAGVIDVFLENNICFDGAIGVSAGATFGCNIKSKQAGRALRYNCKYCKDPHYGSIRSWIKTGNLYDVDFCYKELPEKLDVFDTGTFADNPMEFYVVTTDVESGEPVYHKCSDGLAGDLEWIKASASLPIVSRIVEIEGRGLLDGGMADSVPLGFFQSIGFEKNVVILTQPDDYIKSKNRLVPLCRLIYRKYPKLVDKLADRHIRYNDNIENIRRQEAEGKVFVIRPQKSLGVKKVEKDPDKLRRVYEIGREEAIKALKERGLSEWLAD